MSCSEESTRRSPRRRSATSSQPSIALASQIGRDPVATAMLHDLIDHLASDACDPTLRVLI